MKTLIEAIQKDEQLRGKFESIIKDSKDEITAKTIAIAKEYGFGLTMEDLEPATGKGDLSMDELEAVAGGSGCGCFFYGNGKKDGNVCVLTGGGNKCGCFLVGAR